MRRLLAFIVALTTLSTPLCASYSGNPAQPAIAPSSYISFFANDILQVNVGYQRDDVSDRKVRSSDESFRIDNFAYQTDQGIVSTILLERVEVYGTVGGGSFELRNRPNINLGSQTSRQYRSDDRVVWGAGARAILYKDCNFALGVTANYFEAQPNFDWDDLHQGPNPTEVDFYYNEWQAGIGASLDLGPFIPYAVIKYSAVHGAVNNLQENIFVDAGTAPPYDAFNLRSRHHIGAAFGCTLSCFKSFYLNFEARVLDERAYTVAGGITW